MTDHLEIHLLELPKYNGSVNALPRARPKERWAYFLRHASELTVPEIGRFFPEPAFVEAGGVLDMIAKTPEERLRYDLRLKAQRDQTSNLQAAREEGHQEGRQEGLEEGLQKGSQTGQWLGRIQLLQELLGETPLSSEELRTCDLDRLKHIAESLQTRLRERP